MTSLEFFIAAFATPWVFILILSHTLRDKSSLYQKPGDRLSALAFTTLLPTTWYILETLQGEAVLSSFLLFSEFVIINWFFSLGSHPLTRYLRGRSAWIVQPVLTFLAIGVILHLSPRFVHMLWVWLWIMGSLTDRLCQALNHRENYDLMRQKIVAQQSENLNAEIITFLARQKNKIKKVS